MKKSLLVLALALSAGLAYAGGYDVTYYPPTLDTTVDSNDPNQVMGDDSLLYGTNTSWMLIECADPWDNEIIPYHARVNEANLWVYVDNWDGGYDDEMWLSVSRMLEVWDEGTTYSEIGEPSHDWPVQSPDFDEYQDDQWVATAVTTIVKQWSPFQYTVGSQQPNRGFCLTASSGTCDLDSSEGTNVPQLHINFTPPGDANNDGYFNQLDIVQVLQAGKYGTQQSATWEQGDWNWDGVFDQYDLVTALAEWGYTTGGGGGPLAAFGDYWD